MFQTVAVSLSCLNYLTEDMMDVLSLVLSVTGCCCRLIKLCSHRRSIAQTQTTPRGKLQCTTLHYTTLHYTTLHYTLDTPHVTPWGCQLNTTKYAWKITFTLSLSLSFSFHAFHLSSINYVILSLSRKLLTFH